MTQEEIPPDVLQYIVPALEDPDISQEYLDMLQRLAAGEDIGAPQTEYVVREYKKFLPAFSGSVYRQIAYYLQGIEQQWFDLSEYPAIFTYLLEWYQIRLNPQLGRGQVVPVPDVAADLRQAVGVQPDGRVPATGQPGGPNLPGISAPGRVPAQGGIVSVG